MVRPAARVGAWAVHALNRDQLDVAGDRGTGDQGVRAARVESGERVGQVGDHPAGPDDDQVGVGHQGQRGGPGQGRGPG
jgi:hypothetical protein